MAKRRTTTKTSAPAKRSIGTRKAAAEDPAAQLEGFIDKYSPEVAAEGRRALPKLRRAVPGAVELVYDNYNWLVVGFGPSERASEAVISLVFAPRWLTLCFLQNGPTLPDPDRLLRGAGTQVRNVRLSSASDLDLPAVQSLLREALSRARVPIDATRPRRLIIRSISAKQRPRRTDADAAEGRRQKAEVRRRSLTK